MVICGAIGTALLIRRGFRATSDLSSFDTLLARTVRNLSIPRRDRNAKSTGWATEALRQWPEHSPWVAEEDR
jgi:hypothetical protein